MQATIRPPRRGLPVIAWVGIGCGGLLALGILGVLGTCTLLATTAIRAGCPPSDLPVPPGSRLVGVNGSGGTAGSTCDVTWESTENVTQVSAFYDLRLQRGDWQSTGVDRSTGTVTFHRASRSGVTGQVQLLAHGDQTRIEVHMDSADGRFGR